eukprot:373739-Pelagomonas_calceolata.AAC.1
MAPPRGNILKDRLCQAQAHSAQQGSQAASAWGYSSADGRVLACVLRGHRTLALDMSEHGHGFWNMD